MTNKKPLNYFSPIDPNQLPQMTLPQGRDPVADKLKVLLEIAKKELGVREWFGAKNNPRILEYFRSCSQKISEDEIPWCAAFACWVIEQAKHYDKDLVWYSPASALARKFLTWGYRLETPLPGCICVFSRGRELWQGHVAFFSHPDKSGNLVCVGGNQSDKVSIGVFAKSSLLDLRSPIPLR